LTISDRTRRVVLLIDFDNLQICASRDTPGRDLQLEPVVQLAQRYGTVVVARAYAEWNLSTERLAVYKAGIEPAFAPVLRTESDRAGKSLADTVMVAEGMDILWTLTPDVLVLATSDKDLIPLVRVAKQRGCRVVVLGSDFTAIPLREMADEHITYKQLVTDAAGRYLEGPTVRTVTSTESPRRTRTREGREPRQPVVSPTLAPAAAPPAATPAPTPAATPAPAPAAATTTTPAATAAAAEAVPPVSAGLEADGQATGRRRRRRGSRRRSDRLGVAGEHDDATADGEDEHEHDEELTPSTAEAEEVLGTPELATSELVASEPTPEASAPNAAIAEPTEIVAKATVSQPPLTIPAEPEPVSTSEAVAAEEAPTVNGTDTSSSAVVPAPTEANGTGEPEATAEAPAEPAPKRTRARRVASASRGRSRPVTD
jgi:uncharacterized protein (TIGR00288 family)